jgi:predicted PurR-regulated permease PerM
MPEVRSFRWRALAGIVLAGLALFLLWPGSQIFLVIFAATLCAILVDGLAALLCQHLPLHPAVARSGVMLLLLVLLLAFFVLAGPRFSSELLQLAERLPRAVEQLNAIVSKQPWGRLVADLGVLDGLKPSSGQVLAGVTGVFSTAFGATVNVFVILLIGLYLAIQPELYVRGLLHLIPKAGRQRGKEILDALGHALRWWLVGRFASMTLVGVLITIGLELIGLPLALVLGVIAGLLSFVPYVGPIVSVVPALLIGLTISPVMPVYALVVYVVVLFIEGNFLTPMIQKYAVSLPPAVLLCAQFTMGLFYGLFGILLATPMAVVVIVLIQMLYVQGVLNYPVRVLGEHGTPTTPAGSRRPAP